MTAAYTPTVTPNHVVSMAMLFSLLTVAGTLATESVLNRAGLSSANASFWIASLYTLLVLVLHVRRLRPTGVDAVVCVALMTAGADLALTGLLIKHGGVLREGNPALRWVVEQINLPTLIVLKVAITVVASLWLLRHRDRLCTAGASFIVAVACGLLVYSWAGSLHMLNHIVQIVTPPTSLPALP